MFRSASFAADVDAEKAAFMAESQVPWGVEALSGTITNPAWKTKPSWYLVTTDDKMIPPPAQRLYHSSNPVLAKKWQSLALAALDQALLKPQDKDIPVVAPAKKNNSLLVFYSSNPNQVERSQKTDWIIYGDL